MIDVLRGAVIGGAVLGILLLAAPAQPAPRGVSESEGRIGRVCVHWTGAAASILAPVYRDLFRNFSGTLYVVCPSAENFESFRALTGLTAEPIITGRPTGAWARDRFIAVRAGDRLRLLVPEYPPATPGGTADWLVAWDVARATGAEVRTLPLQFDGGDVWVTRDAAFVNAGLGERARAIFEAELGVKVVLVDGAPHHVGMFMTPLSARVVMLACPGADSPQPWARKLRALRDQLERQGIRVVPLPFVPIDDRVYVTYNNVLIDGNVVYMPTYDRPELDDEAARIWASEGFEVRRIRAVDLMSHRGTVHCLVNVIERR